MRTYSVELETKGGRSLVRFVSKIKQGAVLSCQGRLKGATTGFHVDSRGIVVHRSRLFSGRSMPCAVWRAINQSWNPGNAARIHPRVHGWIHRFSETEASEDDECRAVGGLCRRQMGARRSIGLGLAVARHRGANRMAGSQATSAKQTDRDTSTRIELAADEWMDGWGWMVAE